MKKRFLASFIALLLLFAAIPLKAYAMTPRMQSIIPAISFSGTTAHCEVEVSSDYLTDEISATVRLWQGNKCIETWYPTGSGYLSFYETYAVTRGYKYTLTADVTINDTTFPRVSVSETLPSNTP